VRLPEPERAALAPVLDALPDARLVGGPVRDLLAGLPLHDLDLATALPPQAVMRRLQHAGIKAIPTGLGHGTVTAVVDGRNIEVTTLRRDVATDGRHAQVEFTDDWQADAARRDFTINAMSLDRHGGLHDWFGGQDDLQAGRVRFVGDAAARVAEDYLRILRFFRFQARYGRGAPDAAALEAIRAGVPGLARLSAERVWSELRRILSIPQPGPTLALMQETGVLPAVLPGAHAARLDARLPADPLLRLAAVTEEPADALAARLRLSNAERDRLASLRGPVPAGTDDDLRRALADVPKEALIGRVWLARPEDEGTRARLAALPAPRFPLEGRDAVALGVPPGPRVGQLLAAVRAWWLARGCTDDAAACRAELRRRVLTAGA
jgi:poly(A) polymerase/tRNA nucleotidyltransferase (CCA-adding enzyme)